MVESATEMRVRESAAFGYQLSVIGYRSQLRLDDISANNVWRRGRPCNSDRRFRSLVPALRSRRWLLSRRARAWQKQRRGPTLEILPKFSSETIPTTE